MAKMENENSLDGKMSDWGPFGEHEGEWLIFSVGNPEEGMVMHCHDRWMIWLQKILHTE